MKTKETRELIPKVLKTMLKISDLTATMMKLNQSLIFPVMVIKKADQHD